MFGIKISVMADRFFFLAVPMDLKMLQPEFTEISGIYLKNFG
jgi:hypothetical protein